MSVINRPSVNRAIQPNTSFLQASMNTVNNAINNVFPKNIANNVNNAAKPINESINNAINNNDNAESYVYIVVILGFLVLTLIIVIYFRAQVTMGFSRAWEKLKSLFRRSSPDDEIVPVPIPVPLPSSEPSESSMPSMPLMPSMPPMPSMPSMPELNVANKLIPKRKEVFNVAQDIYTYSDAEPLCKAYGAELATYDQVKEAWKKGADWCNYGWVKGQTALYPTQKATYDKLQAGPESQRGSCGVPGVNGGYFDNPELRFGVNCYGERPDSNEADERYKAANRQNNTPEGMAYDKKVRDFKAKLNQIPINSFDAGSLSM